MFGFCFFLLHITQKKKTCYVRSKMEFFFGAGLGRNTFWDSRIIPNILGFLLEFTLQELIWSSHPVSYRTDQNTVQKATPLHSVKAGVQQRHCLFYYGVYSIGRYVTAFWQPSTHFWGEVAHFTAATWHWEIKFSGEVSCMIVFEMIRKWGTGKLLCNRMITANTSNVYHYTLRWQAFHPVWCLVV